MIRLVKGLNARFAILVTLGALGSASHAIALDPGYRAPDPDNTLVIDTTKGTIVVEMNPLLAPAHVERMITLTRQHFYDGLTFHRVVEAFMDQTGDPKGDGSGGSTLPNLKAEFTVRRDASFPFVVASHPVGQLLGFVGSMPVASQVEALMSLTRDGKIETWGMYCQGTVGMARDNDVNSANSQFFLMRAPNPSLEKHWTAFGRVVSGLDVVRSMKIGEPPVNPDKMLRARVWRDIPEAERPKVEILDTSSPQFRDLLQKTQTREGPNFSPCDVPLSKAGTP